MTLGGGITMEKMRPFWRLLGICAIDAGFDPPLSPVRFEALRLVDLLKLHGKFQRSIRNTSCGR